MILYNIWLNYTTFFFFLAKFAGFYFGVFKDSFSPANLATYTNRQSRVYMKIIMIDPLWRFRQGNWHLQFAPKMCNALHQKNTVRQNRTLTNADDLFTFTKWSQFNFWAQQMLPKHYKTLHTTHCQSIHFKSEKKAVCWCLNRQLCAQWCTDESHDAADVWIK